jgi:two-component system LytT family response regulator
MNTIIIDDEIKSIELTEHYLSEYFNDFCIQATFTNINEAIGEILKNTPDVIFLDINMPNGSGLDLLEQIKHKNIPVIFVTAHAEYAINAIKLDAFDYLLKPINISELNRIHKKLIENSKKYTITTKPVTNKITLKISNTNHIFEQDEIISLSSEGNYTTIYSTIKKPLVITKNLKKVEAEYFYKYPFFRCHQSHLINVNHIKEYSSSECVLSCGKTIPFSNKKYLEFIKFSENQ